MLRAKQIKSERKGNEDMLSDLPDCLLFHILSFMNFIDAVRTCILSRRWKDLWKHLPNLVLHSSDSNTRYDFKNFKRIVSRLLSLRDVSVALHTLDFKHRGYPVKPSFLGKVISYAISHNVQQLLIYTETDISELPPSILSPIFSCQTLTFLKLSVYHEDHSDRRIMFPNSPNLPALTSLYLVNIAFCASGNDQADPFSTMSSLNNLVINYCTLRDAQILCISSTTLSSLTIRSRDSSIKEIVFSTLSPCSFAFEGVPYLCLSGSGLSYIEQVYIDAYTLHHTSEPPLILLEWLKEFANVQSLTITMNSLQVVSLIPDLLNIELLSMSNLKSMKVKVKQDSHIVPDRILNFLLQNSPSAEVSIIKCTS